MISTWEGVLAASSLTFVCAHIVGHLSPDTAGFVFCSPEDEGDPGDTWCEACDAYILSYGDE